VRQRNHSKILFSVLIGILLLSSSTVIPQALRSSPSFPSLPLVSVASSYSSSTDPMALVPYSLKSFHLPNGSAGPWGITSDRFGRIWFVEESSNQIGMFDPSKENFTEYNIPTKDSLPEMIAVDNSGNVWFSELNPSQLGELKAGTSTIVEYKIPKNSQNLSCGPIGVTPDSSGNIWITCEFSNQIDEFIPQGEAFLSFDLPVFFSAPLDIVFDPSGNFWFTAADSGMIGYVTVSDLKNGSSNGINEFAPINQTYAETITNPDSPSEIVTTSLSTPSEIALSPDGNTLWITEHTASSFDKYEISSKTLVKYWTTQTGSSQYPDSLPNGVAVDKNGIVWIAEHYGNKIAEFDPETEEMIEYPIPCCSTGIAGTLYLTAAPDGAIWFSEFYGNAIGELEPSPSGANDGLSVSIGRSLLGMNSTGSTMETSVSLSVQNFSKGEQQLISNATLEASGISSNGTLTNCMVSFDPSTVSLSQNGKNTSVLTIETSGLKAGTYYLTISARTSPQSLIYSTILKVTVFGAPQPDRSLLIEGIILGGAASVAVVGVMAVYLARTRRIRRSSSPRRTRSSRKRQKKKVSKDRMAAD